MSLFFFFINPTSSFFTLPFIISTTHFKYLSCHLRIHFNSLVLLVLLVFLRGNRASYKNLQSIASLTSFFSTCVEKISKNVTFISPQIIVCLQFAMCLNKFLDREQREESKRRKNYNSKKKGIQIHSEK